jgi:putative membrane protein
MKAEKPPAELHDDKKATEYLANERTFLAWVRTSIAIISLGFVVAKFDVWMRDLAGESSQLRVHAGSPHASLIIGIAMMAIGGVFAALAARRYHRVTRDIERGKVQADRGLVGVRHHHRRDPVPRHDRLHGRLRRPDVTKTPGQIVGSLRSPSEGT